LLKLKENIYKEQYIMQKITPFLWFDNKAEEAAKFYVSLFKNSKITSVSPMMVTFELEGQPFMALNGGPAFMFTEAISLFVNCGTQQEVDELWDKLSAEGSTSQCGWLKDKYGLSWQIIPRVLGELMGDPNPEKSGRVMQAMLQMTKIDIEGLQRAYDAI
jgi:predicted 3-demethylubiquinone-9 3-methyltransferase (glyoxalase superfamily)